ncbi:MAG TPA: tetratricopeptide repeat protein [candidate division Zixibacteria bacterium]|nr:tetratricopeptide repeat protein [candidate division Zixibacteria bacterium]
MNKNFTKVGLFILVVIFGTFGSAFSQENDFETGNKYYEQGDFQSAITMYQKVETSGLESSALYFNLGNAYFKNGDLGRAILYYHRAKRLNPSDPDILSNLEFAGKFSTLRMEGVELNPVNAILRTLVGNYRLKTLGWISSLFFVLFIVLLILKYGIEFHFTGLSTLVTTLLVVVIITAGLTTFKYRDEFLTKRAVVIANDSTVYSGPSTNSDLEFEGSSGLVVEIEGESGDFYNVLFENKRRGWIKRDQVAVI